MDFFPNTQNIEFKGYDNGLSTFHQVGLFWKWVITVKGINNERGLNFFLPFPHTISQ